MLNQAERRTRRDRPAGYGRVLVPIWTAGTGNALFLVPSIFDPLHPGIDDSQFFNFVQIIRSLGESRIHLRPAYDGPRAADLQNPPGAWRNWLKYLLHATISLQPHGADTRLVGHCLGGILAFEVARQLSPGASDVSLVLLDTAYADQAFKGIIMPESRRAKEEDSSPAFAALCQRTRRSGLGHNGKALNGRLIKTPRSLIPKLRSFVRYRMSSECRYWADCSSERTHFLDLIPKSRARSFQQQAPSPGDKRDSIEGRACPRLGQSRGQYTWKFTEFSVTHEPPPGRRAPVPSAALSRGA